jgi:signal peptidase I
MDRHQHVSVLVVSDPQPPLPRLQAAEPAAPATAAWLAAANLALTALCTLAVLVTLALTVGPRFFAYETFIVRSGSMEPAIRTGSLVVVQPIQPPRIAVGDVITYRRPEDPDNSITHRVVEVRPASGVAGGAGALTAAPVFRTKGDANAVVDPWEVQLQGIAWRVTLSVPLAGYVFAFTQQPLGRALFLIVPGLGLGALWLHRQWVRLRWPAGCRGQ